MPNTPGLPATPDTSTQRRSLRWLVLTVQLLAAMLALPLLGWWFGVGGPGGEPTRSARPPVFDVCGVGPVPAVRVVADPSGDDRPHWDLPDALGPAALRTWWPVLRARLAADPQPRARAVAMLLPPEPIDARSSAGLSGAAPHDLRPLVELAKGSTDPQVVAWALTVCRGGLQPAPSATACSGLGPRDWLRLAPDNLLPWLMLLAEEPGAQDEALHGLAAARVVANGQGELARWVDAAWPAEAPPHLRVQAGIQALLLDVQLALAVAPWPPLVHACSAQALQQTGRRQVCEAIAQTMATQGADLPALVMAGALGKALGWPAQRVAALQAERERLQTAHPMPWAAAGGLAGMHSCAAVQAMRHWTAELAAHGELGALRRADRARWLKPGAAVRPASAPAGSDAPAPR